MSAILTTDEFAIDESQLPERVLLHVSRRNVHSESPAEHIFTLVYSTLYRQKWIEVQEAGVIPLISLRKAEDHLEIYISEKIYFIHDQTVLAKERARRTLR